MVERGELDRNRQSLRCRQGWDTGILTGGIRSLLKIRLAFSFAVSCRATAYEHQTKGVTSTSRPPVLDDERSCDQWLLSSMTTTSVGSGSWGARLVNCASLQLARFTTVPAGAPASILSFASTTFNPLLSRKNVWSPNNSFNFGTNGWSSGITWASNCVKVCSTCVEFSFITDSIRLLCRASA